MNNEIEHSGVVALGDGRDAALEALTNLLVSELGDTYSCTRVWSAWGYGTMTQDDFEPAEERAGEIADSILRAIPALTAALARPAQEPVGHCIWITPTKLAACAKSSQSSFPVYATPQPSHTTNCCKCGRIIDTREKKDGGDDFGAEMSDGRWTCSIECDDAVINPTHTQVAGTAGLLTDPAPVAEIIAKLREDMTASPVDGVTVIDRGQLEVLSAAITPPPQYQVPVKIGVTANGTPIHPGNFAPRARTECACPRGRKGADGMTGKRLITSGLVINIVGTNLCVWGWPMVGFSIANLGGLIILAVLWGEE